MAGIIDSLKYRFNNAPVLKQLIYTNVAVFVAVHLVSVILLLFNIDTKTWLSYIEVPSDLNILPYRLWTILTYMFVHYDVWHILFNMLWLYWFGEIFIQYFSQRHLTALYFMGGIAGAIMYLLSYNIFPYFADRQGMMCGASAAIMAIVFATTLRTPDYKINLMFIGSISLKYIAGVTILIDLLSMTSPNAGGHFAHIGGAIMGIIFGWFWNKGKDILRPINGFMDKIVTLFQRPYIRIKKPKISRQKSDENKRRSRPESDEEYHMRKKRENDEIDRLLDKIKKSGYSALTTEEKQKLFDVRKNNPTHNG